MSSGIILPSIDNRMAGWLAINRKIEESKKKKKQKHYTITISREFGCNAPALALELKKQLDNETNTWSIFDKELIARAAETSEFSERILNNLGEASRYMDAFVGTFQRNWKKDIDGYKVLWKHITGLAKQGNVIIVGRGSSYITRELENCFQFHLVASREFRIRSLMERERLSEDEAIALLDKRETQRLQFMKKFLDEDAYNPYYYDLFINVERSTPEIDAKIILTYLRERTGAHGTFPEL